MEYRIGSLNERAASAAHLKEVICVQQNQKECETCLCANVSFCERAIEKIFQNPGSARYRHSHFGCETVQSIQRIHIRSQGKLPVRFFPVIKMQPTNRCSLFHFLLTAAIQKPTKVYGNSRLVVSQEGWISRRKVKSRTTDFTMIAQG